MARKLNFVAIFVVVGSILISQTLCAIQYPATIETKGGGQAGTAIVDLRNAENYDLAYFTYEATFVMGSTTKIVVRGSTADGDRIIQNAKLPGEDFTRVIEQKVIKTRDANGVHITVNIQSTLKLAGTKEKYGKSSIGVRVASGPRPAHYWDIKHEYSNNYEGEDEGGVCLGCEEEVVAPVYAPPPPVDDGPAWDSPPYAYNYGVSDSPTQSLYRSDVQSDGQVIRGEYRVLLPDGRTQIVTYTADWKNGYVPVVRYE